MKIEFQLEENEGLTPLLVADALISMQASFTAFDFSGMESKYNEGLFGLDQLEQIAEHLMVYCRHHRGDRS